MQLSVKGVVRAKVSRVDSVGYHDEGHADVQ